MCGNLVKIAMMAAVLAVTSPAPAAGVITPDDPGYSDKITKEKAVLKKAVMPVQMLEAHLESATERLSEMDVLARKKKFDYIPQLVVSYVTHMKACKKNLELPEDMRQFGRTPGRKLIELVFPHTTTLASIARDVPGNQRKSVEDAAALAKVVHDLTVAAWKNRTPDAKDPAIPPRNVRIDVKTTDISVEDDMFAGLNWQYRDKNVEAEGKGNILARNGLRVTVGSVRVNLSASIGSGRVTRNRMTNQFIVVMSGKTAMINIGTTYLEPAPIMIFELGTGNVWLSQTHRLAKAGAFLEVQPTVIPGGLVRVTVTPVLSYWEEGRQVLKLSKLSTTVIVPDGQSIVIGGLNTDDNTFGKAFFRTGRRSRKANKVITLTARIQKPMIFMPRKKTDR
jgi:hypothetical protein